jgi:60 kDa SS-A/Ro ribonucleoprotein
VTSDALAKINLRQTPQIERADERQQPNHGGGYSFVVDDVERLRRFLTLGVAGGTFYVKERELALDNAQVVVDLCANGRAKLVVDEVVRISTGGLAPRQQPALFALAIACSNGTADERRYAFARLNDVARTGYTLFKFVQYMGQFRGWGRMAKRAVGEWYLRDVERLAFQVVKYRQREGWTHRDMLRLAHPKTDTNDLARRKLFDWICGRVPRIELVSNDENDALRILEGYERVQHCQPSESAELVRDFRLPWEALPDAVMNRPDVWEALLENGLPATALMRQLPRLTRLGLLPQTGGWTNEVVHMLTNVERLQRGRVHPLNVLIAQRVYAFGQSERGSSTWTPSRRIVDALDTAFYAAYGAVEPTGKRLMLSLDVSASMTWTNCAGMPITPRDASAAIALVTAATEDEYHLNAFSENLSELAISPRQRLDDAVHAVSRMRASGTDCALPMRHALERKLEIDTFVIYTDSETNRFNSEHPFQALRRYRERTGIAAKLVVVGMTATKFTIAEPGDAGMLDVAGCDASVPQVISSFARGRINE